MYVRATVCSCCHLLEITEPVASLFVFASTGEPDRHRHFPSFCYIVMCSEAAAVLNIRFCILEKLIVNVLVLVNFVPLRSVFSGIPVELIASDPDRLGRYAVQTIRSRRELIRITSRSPRRLPIHGSPTFRPIT